MAKISKRQMVPRATFPLMEGQAAFEVPLPLSEESYDELKIWVDLMMTLTKRSCSPPAGEEG